MQYGISKRAKAAYDRSALWKILLDDEPISVCLRTIEGSDTFGLEIQKRSDQVFQAKEPEKR